MRPKPFRLIAALAVLAAPLFDFGMPAAQAAQLDVGDLFVHYATQTETTATGTIAFNIRFAALNGDPGGYDLVSTQVMLARLGLGGSASFSLNESATEDTAALGAAYWLPAVPTGLQNASTVGGEFRFTDFVSVAQAHTPAPGAVIARFVLDFSIDSADEFGSYEILAGDASQNYFSSNLFNSYLNQTQSATVLLTAAPEPASAVCLLLAACLLRRRRNAA